MSPNKRRKPEGTTSTFDQDVSIHVDEAVACASISPSGRDVVLASRNGLFILDLDSPYRPPRHFPHISPWDVVDVQWSPFASRDYWIVSTSNQKALVWNLNLSGRDVIEHVLHGHDRAITDINFSAHHPDMLATCGVDSYILTWDLRVPNNLTGRFWKDQSTKDLVTRFADWDSGATQVKWNRQNQYIIGSSHHKYLRIWDTRFGAQPVKTIDAHSTKIYGIDWNRTEESKILTCSLDKTIKLWDYNVVGESGEIEPQRVIRTNYPVWRARHTPFGHGLLAMPQNDDHDLHLYDSLLSEGIERDDWPLPVHDFQGHDAKVKEFLWRFRGGIEDGRDMRNFQLVSLGMDRNLHLHSIEPDVLERVGFLQGQPANEKLKLTRLGAKYRSFTVEEAEELSREEEEEEEGEEGEEPEDKNYFMKGKGPEQGGKSELSALLKPSPAGQIDESSSQRGTPVAKKVGFHATTNTIRIFDPIQWMSGVKVGKREPRVFVHQTASNNILSQRHRWTWNSAENLGDEIASVGDKYKKVSFEDVDVQGRTAVVFLSGPWGQDNKSVPMRINFEFPQSYPRTSPPNCKIERTTASIPDDTLKRIDFEVHAIADMCRKRQKGSLEAIICYLLGERGLEESISWLSDDINDLIAGIELIEESDSDEEDEIGELIAQEQDMEMSGTELGAKNDNANVPIPKECGAFWGNSGELAIFRPPKPESEPLFTSYPPVNYERFSKTARLKENFDRMHAASPEPDKGGSSVVMVEEDELSRSDWSSSSSSSGSEEFGSYHTFDRYGNLLGLSAGLKKGGRARFTKTSQESTSADHGTRSGISKGRSIIALHNFEDLLPAKRVLAEEYEIYGEGPWVAQHNSEVARRHGYSELADIWMLIKLILANEVPLEVLPQQHRREPILVLARRAIVRIKRKDSGLDLDFDGAEAVANPVLKGRVKWGHHPLAATWLIPALFEHFEREADTQMLGMLSCMFAEPAGSEAVSMSMLRLRQNELPMWMQAPAFSLDYFSSQEAAWSLFQPTLSLPPTPIASISRRALGQSINLDKLEKRLDFFGSAGSSNGPWGSDTNPSEPVTPYSTGNTPPVLSRTNTFRSSATASFSTSPEHIHTHTRRSNSNLSAAFASFSRQWISSSPPANQKARLSEGDLSTSAPNSAVTWGTTTVYGNSSTTSSGLQRYRHRKRYSVPNYDGTFDEYEETEEAAYSDTEGYSDSDEGPSAAELEPAVTVRLKNQDQFDDEASLSAPLLAHVDAWKLPVYRQQYAEQLLVWGLPVQSSEILKFNGLASYWSEHQNQDDDTPQLNLDIGRKQVTPGTSTPQAHQSTPQPSQSQHIYFPKKAASTTAGTTTVNGSLSSSPKAFKFNPDAPAFVPSTYLAPTPLQPLPTVPSLNAFHTPFPDFKLPSTDGTLTPLTPYEPRVLSAGAVNSHDDDRHLLLTGPDTAAASPDDWHALAVKLPACITCWQKISGLYRVCDACGHTAHASCVPPESAAGGGGCGVGCGCECGEGEGKEGDRAEEGQGDVNENGEGIAPGEMGLVRKG